ncbi:unnamed protein product [Linum trigynum]
MFASLHGGGRAGELAALDVPRPSKTSTAKPVHASPLQLVKNEGGKMAREPAVTATRKGKLRKNSSLNFPRMHSKAVNFEEGAWVNVPVREGMVKAPSLINSLESSLEKNVRIELIETSCEGDGDRFELRSRRQGPDGSSTGHVQQVVRAFEAGMSFHTDPSSPRVQAAPNPIICGLGVETSSALTGELGDLNEYGSNDAALLSKDRKRAFQAADGDECEPPTPKK